MIKQIFTLIWNRRRQNAWVLIELFLVFLVMWFLIDFIGTTTYHYIPPLGYNIEDVYLMEMDLNNDLEVDVTRTNGQCILEIADRLSRIPEVESVGIDTWSFPMSATNYGIGIMLKDSSMIGNRRIMVTPGWMDVFQFRLREPDRPFDRMNSSLGEMALSVDAYDRLVEKHLENGLPFDRNEEYQTNEGNPLRLYNIVEDFRENRFLGKSYWLFYHLTENEIASYDGWPLEYNITFRLRPGTDSPDFRETFLEKNRDLLSVDQIYLVDIMPYSDMEEWFVLMYGIKNRVQMYAVITVFLLINVFLGLIGTFWFRTRQRRAEIGLRVALGSDYSTVGKLLYSEGWALLTIVAIPAAVLCWNAAYFEFSLGEWVLVARRPVAWGWVRFVSVTLSTYFLIGLILTAGIWYPARQAMGIQPAEALHEE